MASCEDREPNRLTSTTSGLLPLDDLESRETAVVALDEGDGLVVGEEAVQSSSELSNEGKGEFGVSGAVASFRTREASPSSPEEW